MILKKVKNEVGATAIEYGLIASLISVLAVSGMSAVGVNLSNTYCTISKHLGGSGTCSGNADNSASTGGSASANGSAESSTSSGYSGAYSNDVNVFLDNLKNKEQKYIGAWNATQELENTIYAKMSSGDQSGADELANTQLNPLKVIEEQTYEELRNGNNNDDDYGLTTGLNQIFSNDYNNSLSTSGQTETEKTFSTIRSATFTSSIGKTYSLGELWPDPDNTYIDDLKVKYPRH